MSAEAVESLSSLNSIEPVVSMILRSLELGGKIIAIGSDALVSHLLRRMLHREGHKRPFPCMSLHKDFLPTTQIEALGENVDTLLIFEVYKGPSYIEEVNTARQKGVATAVISVNKRVSYLPDINIVTTIAGSERVIDEIISGVEKSEPKV